VQVEGVEGCRVVSKGGSGASLKQACELLGVDAKALCQCLTFRELQTTAPGMYVSVFPQ
jgi:myosin heavy subunit